MGDPHQHPPSSRRVSSASDSSALGPADSDGARGIRSLLPGGKIGDYELIELLGKGAMGRVFRAHDPAGREVAIKILSDRPEADDAERFQREGEALARIPPHRHVLRVHTMGTVHGRPYLVLDLIEGETLQSQLIKGARPPLEAAAIVEQLSEALDHIHQAGVLHRDLKPANIILRPNGEPVVTDFGMASMVGSARLTRSGGLYGTPGVMSPEQILGKASEVDGRSDVWALGVLLYLLLSGEFPFEARNIQDLAQKVVREAPPPLQGIDEELATIVTRALAKAKDDRFETPGHMARALRLWRISTLDSAELAKAVKREPLRLPWRTLGAVGAGVLALVLGSGGWLWWSERAHEARRRALLDERAALQQESRELVPNLLGRGRRWVRLTQLERLEQQTTSLEQQADEADVPLDTSRIREMLDYLRLELALREGDQAQAGTFLARLPTDGEVSRLLRARQAVDEGQAPTAELLALGGSSDPQVAAAANVLRARLLADEDPLAARELLGKSADEALIGPELSYVEALARIRTSEPSPASVDQAVGTIRQIEDPGVLVRLRRVALARCQELAAARPWSPTPVLALLGILAALPPQPAAREGSATDTIVGLAAEILFQLDTDDGSPTPANPATQKLPDPDLGLQLLAAAGEARLAGLDRLRGLELYDGLTKAATFRGLPTTQFLVALRALVLLDVPIRAHFLGHTVQPPKETADPAGAFLYLLYERNRDFDTDEFRELTQEEKRERDRREDEHAERTGNLLRDKLLGEWAQALGPRTRAAGLVNAHHERMTYEESRILLEEAYALDPENPRVLMQMALLYGLAGDRDRCADFADRAVAGYRALGAASRLLGYSSFNAFYKDLIEVQARYGYGDRARRMAESVFAVQPLSPEDRVEFDEDLERWLKEGDQRRAAEKQAAEKQAAEKQAAEKQAAEKQAAEKAPASADPSPTQAAQD